MPLPSQPISKNPGHHAGLMALIRTMEYKHNHWAFLAATAAVLVCLAVTAPLIVYTITLAVFGLPHVFSELRYVDLRFGRSLSMGVRTRIGVLLLAIAATRTSSVFHWFPYEHALVLELGLVVVLALSVAFGSLWQRIMASVLALGIGIATALSPFDTAVAFSILHNLTPLGFLWQIIPVEKRSPAMSAALFGFVGLPLIIATGLPRLALAHCGLPTMDADLLGAGSLASQLFVYVPPPLIASTHAVDLFSASVVAQGAHYLCVILILPKLLARVNSNAQGILPWPSFRLFWGAVCIVAAIGFTRFLNDFVEARALYGIFASIHAWIEIPILIIALCGTSQASINSPKRQDALLAISETSMAR